MTDAAAETITVGTGTDARPIAVLRRSGAAPGVFWLGGFMSDMGGTKAEALDRWAGERGRACTRFDYSGHGRSGGSFGEGTISRWLAEAEAVFATTDGPQIVVGSSMGGWIALLLAVAERVRSGVTSRVAGLVLIAPAVDMTEELMWRKFPKAVRREIEETGVWRRPSAYAANPYLITRGLIEDGRQHVFGEQPIEPGCPVHILQGQQDEDVPWQHASMLVSRLASDDVVLTLVKDGDHRLSRPEDLERLYAAVEGVMAE